MVLDAFARDGEAVFNRISGEFALALFDKRSGRLTLARDALGRRPLHHAAVNGRTVFASEATPVAQRLRLTSPDLTETARFLMQRGQRTQRSFFQGVSRVPPGSLVRYEADGRQVSRAWWAPDFTPTDLGDDELLAALDEKFTASIAAILQRHDRIAAHLSAGLDSSLAVATVSILLKDDDRLKTYCISPAHPVEAHEQAIGDEYPLACETARMLGNVDVSRVCAADDDWLAESDRYMQAAGMPYRNMSNLCWFSASYAAAARDGATGLIESTDGNGTLSWMGNGAMPSMIRQRRLGEMINYIRDVRREGSGSGALAIPWGLWALLPGALADPLAALGGVARAEVVAFLRPRHPAVRAAAREIRNAGHWNRKVRPIRDAEDRFTLLHWSDRAPHFSAVERLFGIELCDPYSSKALVELTSRIEEHRFLEGGFGRRFARALLKGRVPDTVSAGRIDWLQATDWRIGAIASRPALLNDLAYAAGEPELVELYDLPAMAREIKSWELGAETAKQMSRGFAVLRAIGTIRFARWAATLKSS